MQYVLDTSTPLRISRIQIWHEPCGPRCFFIWQSHRAPRVAVGSHGDAIFSGSYKNCQALKYKYGTRYFYLFLLLSQQLQALGTK